MDNLTFFKNHLKKFGSEEIPPLNEIIEKYPEANIECSIKYSHNNLYVKRFTLIFEENLEQNLKNFPAEIKNNLLIKDLLQENNVKYFSKIFIGADFRENPAETRYKFYIMSDVKNIDFFLKYLDFNINIETLFSQKRLLLGFDLFRDKTKVKLYQGFESPKCKNHFIIRKNNENYHHYQHLKDPEKFIKTLYNEKMSRLFEKIDKNCKITVSFSEKTPLEEFNLYYLNSSQPKQST